ncbi:MAG TPA: thiamine pyrophosphate-binding protein [Myxococcales bacterium]|jgi:acetolactate synthase-1/2/3 large subunit|nr:thiamine pyrophosphate-binding protein [Myxococcales bacterium]
MGRRSTVSGTGGQILVQSLVTHGVDHVFCVPGESHLAVLDALYDVRDRVKLVACRHESGASNMAEAYGKLTGRPGVALVTRGPGATNASIGVHTAFQDSTPLLLLVGQVPRRFADREAFQEIDYRRMFGQMTKWAAQIDDARRVPEYVSRAFQTTTAGRQGPVVLALPEDMLTEQAEAPATPAYRRVACAPAAESIARLVAALSEAKRPIVVAGGSGWTEAACADLRKFVEAWRLPVTCAFRFQDLFDNDHPQYAGDVGIGINPKLARRMQEADLALVLGARLGEMTTSGYTLLDAPVPRQTLVHAHAGAEELGRVYAADVFVQATMPELAAALSGTKPRSVPVWANETAAARADYETWNAPVRIPGSLQLAEVMHSLRERLPPETIVANGAGNFSSFLHRFHRYRRFKTQLGATSGAMGYGTPAAVAAKSVHPDRTVLAVCGDGDFLMTGQELATAVQYGLAIVILVVNNGMYGTIRMHQERHYPGRVHGTSLRNPDFAAYARAFGAHGELVETTEQFAPALDRALAAGRPALLELRLAEEAITPSTTLTAIRDDALKKRRRD